MNVVLITSSLKVAITITFFCVYTAGGWYLKVGILSLKRQTSHILAGYSTDQWVLSFFHSTITGVPCLALCFNRCLLH